MTKLIKRAALVGLLSGLTVFGAACQRGETGGAGTAGTEADQQNEQRPSELQNNPNATGGSGADDSITGGGEDEGESGMNIGGGTGSDIGSTDENLQQGGSGQQGQQQDSQQITH